MHLLERVQGNQTLKKGELAELKRYEEMAKKKKKTEKKVQRAKGPNPRSRKKTKAKRRRRCGPTAAAVKLLGLETGNFAEADERAGLDRPLARLLAKNKKLSAAWERGRFLRDLGELAATAVTINEAEGSLQLEAGTLKTMLADDREAADIWNSARLATTIEIKKALVAQAVSGKPMAARQIENILRREIARPRADFHHLSIELMVELTGKTRQTVHSWYSKHGLPRNSDKTFDLTVFLNWFEEFTLKKAGKSTAPQSVFDTNPLAAKKAEKLTMEIAAQKGQLLPRSEVIAGLLARHQAMINAMARKAGPLAMSCHGQTTDKIAGMLEKFFDEVKRDQCQVPDEFGLPPEAMKKLIELMEMIE